MDSARALAWGRPGDPGDWHPVTRAFRGGHTETWFAAGATLAGGDQTAPGGRWWPPSTRPPCRPRPHGIWSPTCPVPGGPREAGSPHPAACLAEIVRIYGIRHWTGQGYKQVKDQLGWADFQVRSDTAIRRHQALSTARQLLLGRLVRR